MWAPISYTLVCVVTGKCGHIYVITVILRHRAAWANAYRDLVPTQSGETRKKRPLIANGSEPIMSDQFVFLTAPIQPPLATGRARPRET